MSALARVETGEGQGGRRLDPAAGLTPAFVVGENVGGAPEEGYRIITRRLAEALRRQGSAQVFSIGGDPADDMRLVRNWRPLLSPELAAALRRDRPRTVFYIHAVTLPALLRGRVLASLGGSRVVMVAPEPVRLDGLAGALAGPFWPDLVLVSTDAERREVRALGGAAARFSTGVDTCRFRPALPGEKAELRRRWGLPDGPRIVLHVGHLKPERNMQAMAALAHRADFLPVVLASGLRARESDRVRTDLQRSGILVLDGFRPHVEELYRAADCYVFPVPHRFGAIAMPLSVLEAMASDLPVATTAFGALPERFPGADGVAFFQTQAELVTAVEGLLQRRPSTRELVAPYSWEAVVSGLLEQAATVAPAERRPALPSTELVLATLRRRFWHLDDFTRQRFWSRELGFDRRPNPEAGALHLGGPPRVDLGLKRDPLCTRIGLLAQLPATEHDSAFAAVARLSGLELDVAPGWDARKLLGSAIADRRPLIGLRLGNLALPGTALARLRSYVEGGGWALALASGPEADADLETLGRALGVVLPRCHSFDRAGMLSFSAQRPDLAFELTGARMEAVRPPAILAGARGRVIAEIQVERKRLPVLVEVQVGGGGLLVSSGGDALPVPLQEAWPAAAMAVTPAFMAIRRLYGQAAWHPPFALANVVVDDPALRRGLIGLDYAGVVEEARRSNFHVTAATIPAELELAEAEVLDLLRRESRWVSACYHGNEHRGYEFYVAAQRRVRFRKRSLAAQAQSLRAAAARGTRFAATTRYQLDRVMVFPHGVGPAAILAQLGELGFIASCNWLDRFPLAAPVPDVADLGMRPADLAWSGFPLLWRRASSDGGGVLDLFLGRPAILFCHPHDLRRGVPADLLARIGEINAAGRGRVSWAGLEQVARHAYLQRRTGAGSWEVLMTGNEACLHNPEPEARRVTVLRPQRPAGTWLSVADETPVDSGELQLTLGPGATAIVRLMHQGAAALPVRGGCAI